MEASKRHPILRSGLEDLGSGRNLGRSLVQVCGRRPELFMHNLRHGDYCASCATPSKKTLSWWNKLSLPKKIVIGFAVGFGGFQVVNLIIAYLMDLTANISGS